MGAAGDLDEFAEIARLFRPLSRGDPQARDLADDVAVIRGRAGFELVITTDALVEGVHFLTDDPPDLVGRKLLRVNLSDLAAKGAEPFGWLLNVAWPATTTHAVRAQFARGLAEDQQRYGLTLFGGDTVSTPGPWTLAATMLGWTPTGAAPSRVGARPGDVLLISGTIGDGGLGLAAARAPAPFGADAEALIARYRLPEPRLALREVVRSYAHASCDVSDGLLADAGRLADASGCAVEVALERLPLSEAAARHVERAGEPAAARVALACGGDDYEVCIAVDAASVANAVAEAAVAGVALTPIGAFVSGGGVQASFKGAPQRLGRLGWTH